jgi:hypothetical protein
MRNRIVEPKRYRSSCVVFGKLLQLLKATLSRLNEIIKPDSQIVITRRCILGRPPDNQSQID